MTTCEFRFGQDFVSGCVRILCYVVRVRILCDVVRVRILCDVVRSQFFLVPFLR